MEGRSCRQVIWGEKRTADASEGKETFSQRRLREEEKEGIQYAGDYARKTLPQNHGL